MKQVRNSTKRKHEFSEPPSKRHKPNGNECGDCKKYFGINKGRFDESDNKWYCKECDPWCIFDCNNNNKG